MLAARTVFLTLGKSNMPLIPSYTGTLDIEQSSNIDVAVWLFLLTCYLYDSCAFYGKGRNGKRAGLLTVSLKGVAFEPVALAQPGSL